MHDRLWPLLAVLTSAGCRGGDTEATATPSLPSVGPTSAAPTPSSAAPNSPTASPTPSRTPGRSASPASTKDGTYTNEIGLSEDGALSYVPMRWHSGREATARYAEKDAKAEGVFCEEYYYEEASDRAAAALIESTSVRSLNGDLKPADASLTDLVQAMEDEAWPNFQIAVSGGRVTQITKVFTP